MANYNKVIIVGNLTKDPEVRYTAGGVPVANLRLAINRKWKDKTGNAKEEVCYVTAVAWNKLAEICGEYVKKGDPILVEGRLQSKSWETEDKQKRTALEVVAENIQFLKGKTSGASSPGEEPEGTPTSTFGDPGEDMPF